MKKPTATDLKNMNLINGRSGKSAFVKKIIQKQQDKLGEYLRKNLKDLGHEFNSEKEFYEFLKEKVHRVVYPDQKYDLFINYKSEDDRGTFIGGYSEVTELVQEGSSAKITHTTNFK